MARATRQPRLTQSSASPSHPREKMRALLTLALGLLALVFGVIESTHVPGAWLGAAGLVVGAISQFLSTTSGARMMTIIGVVFAFTGTLLAVGHGGFL